MKENFMYKMHENLATMCVIFALLRQRNIDIDQLLTKFAPGQYDRLTIYKDHL